MEEKTKHSADLILEYIRLKGISVGDIAISKETGLPIKEVRLLVAKMSEIKPLWFSISEGYGDNKIMIGVVATYLYAIQQFLLQGGFTNLFQQIEAEEKSKSEREKLELIKLRREVWVIKNSWWLWPLSVIVTAIISPIVVEVWKELYQTKKTKPEQQQKVHYDTSQLHSVPLKDTLLVPDQTKNKFIQK